MERLPQEIRIRILQSLANQDKLTCLFVSKDWNRFIKPCLYSNVQIQNSSRLTSAIAYFKKYPEIANSVKHFGIRSCDNALLCLLPIQKLFPNLKRLDFSNSEGLQLIYPPDNTHVPGTWNSLKEVGTSERITTNSQSMVGLILSNFCPNLARLFLCVLPSSDLRLTNIVLVMQNAPQLSQFEITSMINILPELETIHRHAPKLKSLRLSTLGAIEPNRSPRHFETVQLDNLYLQFAGVPNTIARVFNYISSKYTGLKTLSITTSNPFTRVYGNFPTVELERIALNLFAHCPQLTYYDQIFIPLTTTTVNEMDRCGIQLNGIKLYIDEDSVENQCAALSNSNQILSINHVFLQTQQYSSRLDHNDSIHAETIKRALISLVSLSNLASLTIDINRLVCFTQLTVFLDLMPQLSKISLHSMRGSLEVEPIERVFTNLAIKSVEIHIISAANPQQVNIVMQELLSHCPDLEELVLYMVTMLTDDKSSCIMLDFRQCFKLKSVNIDLNEPTDWYGLYDSQNTEIKRNQYYIMRNVPGCSGYYLYDRKKNMLVKKDYLKPGEYYTKLQLSRSLYLNSCQV